MTINENSEIIMFYVVHIYTDCCGFNVFDVYSVAVQIEIYIMYICTYIAKQLLWFYFIFT